VHAPLQAVVFEIKPGRSGQYARDFLRHDPPRGGSVAGSDPHLGRQWSGSLVVDDYAGYKALFAPVGRRWCGTAMIGQDEWVGAAGVFVRCAQPFAVPP
jgi:hypothetical protein